MRTADEGVNLISALRDKKAQIAAEKAMEASPQEVVMNEIYSFYTKQMKTLDLREDLTVLLEDKIRELLSTEGALSASQVLSLYKSLQGAKTNATKVLLDVLRPVPNAVSPMLPANQAGMQDDMALSKFSSQDLELLDSVMRRAQQLTQTIPDAKTDD